MPKSPRHKRLYKDSPTLARDEDGNMKATKSNDKRGEKPTEAEKDSTEVQSGIDGMKVTEPEQARIQEIKDMHTRHQKEMESIHKRHQKEDMKKYDNPNGDGDEKPGAGEKVIDKIENEHAE